MKQPTQLIPSSSAVYTNAALLALQITEHWVNTAKTPEQKEIAEQIQQRAQWMLEALEKKGLM